MILIAAVDINWGLGNDGRLLAHIPQDLKRFKQITTGNVIIMGRKTLESFPESKPLPGRVNIVVTNRKSYKINGAVICGSMEEAITVAKQYTDKQVFSAGGGSVYRQCLPYCDTAYITKIHRAFSADTFLENLDTSSEWSITDTSSRQSHNGLEFTYITYQRPAGEAHR